jgi:outer membrane receptor protein involved in Fe transport
VQSRFQGEMVLNPTWTSGIQVDKNEVDPNAYLDLRVSYKWTPNIQLYGVVDDLLNTPPILLAPLASTGTSYQQLGFAGDNLGRVMRIGFRVSYQDRRRYS